MSKLMLILGAIKEVASLVKMFKNMYDKWVDNRITKHYKKKRDTINRIIEKEEAELQKPVGEQDDEKLKELHRNLVNLGHRQ